MSTLSLKAVLELVDRASRPLRNVVTGTERASNALRASQQAMRGLQRTQADISSFRAVSKALQDNRTELTAARQKAAQLATAHAAMTRPTAAMTKELDRARKKVRDLKQAETEQVRQLQQLRSSLGQAGVSTNNLGQAESQLRSRVDAATRSIRQQQQALAQAAAQQQRLNDIQRQHQAAQQRMSNIAAKSAAGVAVGAAAAYGGARFIQSGTDLDKNMSKVYALGRLDASSPEAKALRDQALALGSSTSFTAADAASGQSFLAMAGFTPEAIKKALPSMLSLATAGDMDLATTADIGSNILTAMKMKSEEMGKLSDVMTATMTRSNTSVFMMGETLKYVAPVAADLGVDIETLAASTGKLGDAGIQASMAGTALRSILGRLAAPPKMAADALEELGIKTEDAKGNLRNFPEILKELNEKTKNLGNTERSGFFKAIAGEEAFSALSVLSEQAGNGKLQELINTNYQSTGEAATVATKMAQNLAGDWITLTSAIDGVRVAISDAVKDDLQSMLKSLTEVAGSITAWAKANPELANTLMKIAGGLILIITVVAGVSAVILGLLGPIALLKTAFAVLGLSMSVNPVFILLLALTVLGAVIYKNRDALKQWWDSLGAGSKIALSFGGALTVAFSVLAGLGMTSLRGAGNTLLWLGRILLTNPIVLAITAIAVAAYLIYKHWEPIKAYAIGLWNDIGYGIDMAWQAITGFFNSGIANISATIANWSILGLFTQAFSAVMSWFGIELPSKFTAFGTMLMQGLANGISAGIAFVVEKAKAAANAVTDTAKSVLGIHSPSRVFAKLGGYTMQGLEQGLLSGAAMPINAIGRTSSDMIKALDTSQIQIDRRPPLTAATASGRAGGQAAPVTINMTINAAAGMDTQQLAQLVAAEVAKATRPASNRAALYDTE